MAEINTTGNFAQGVALRSTSATENRTVTQPQTPNVVAQDTGVDNAIAEREALRARREALEFNDNTDPLQQAAEAITDFIPDEEVLNNTTLRIEQDEATGRFIYQSVDNVSGEVLRQFPPEQILEFLAFYREPEGIVVDDEA
jgi:flagellar protein FlaG